LLKFSIRDDMGHSWLTTPPPFGCSPLFQGLSDTSSFRVMKIPCDNRCKLYAEAGWA